MPAVCWSVTQQIRTHGGAVLHLQGGDYGKAGRTLCGRSFFSSELYDYGVMSDQELTESDPVLCKRCRASLRQYRMRNGYF
jgi:hypothetical protein